MVPRQYLAVAVEGLCALGALGVTALDTEIRPAKARSCCFQHKLSTAEGVFRWVCGQDQTPA